MKLIITQVLGGGEFGTEYEEVVSVQPTELSDKELALLLIGDHRKYLVADCDTHAPGMRYNPSGRT